MTSGEQSHLDQVKDPGRDASRTVRGGGASRFEQVDHDRVVCNWDGAEDDTLPQEYRLGRSDEGPGIKGDTAHMASGVHASSRPKRMPLLCTLHT